MVSMFNNKRDNLEICYLKNKYWIGYVLDPHNLVGISRLRGRNLKRLEVSMLDPPASNMMDSFIEVSN